jgi:hypothetical protein
MVTLSLELLLLIVTVVLSAISVALAYDTRVFQKRTAIRETLSQLEPFVETNPYFKIKHSLSSFRYLPPRRGVELLFRYISFFESDNAMGGQPRQFHEILQSNPSYPKPRVITDDVKQIEGVDSVEFTDHGLVVQIDSLNPLTVVEIVHQIQRIFRYYLRKPDTQ